MNDFDIVSYNGKKYIYSVYSTNPKINCGELCKTFLNGGGHKAAAGGESLKFLTEE